MGQPMIPKVYSETFQTSKIERCAKIAAFIR